MPTNPIILAYFAPETVLPLTSIVATAVGVAMMFGRGALGLVTRWARKALPGGRRGRRLSGPHFRVGGRVGGKPADVRRESLRD